MNKERTILLLENDEDDVFVFRRALATLGFEGQVRVVSTLAQARDYMLLRGTYYDRDYDPLPDLIVADFGLGGDRGTEFVQWLLEQPEFLSIPVIFFSGSLPTSGLRDLFERFKFPVFKKDVDFYTNIKTVREMIQLLEEPEDFISPPSSNAMPNITPPPLGNDANPL